MKIIDYSALLNNGTILNKDQKVGDEIPWATLHWAHSNNRIIANQVQFKTDEDATIITAEIGIELQSFTETMSFAELDPVRIILEEEHKGQILAYYHFKDWWTRPSFVNSFNQVPENTTLLFFFDGTLYHFWIALPGKVFRAHFQGCNESENQVELILSADSSGYVSLNEDSMLAVSDANPYRCFEKGMADCAKLYNIPMRDQRLYPDTLEKIGWCSWDAFYKDVNHDGMINKANEIKNKEIPFGWLLIDDGWQDYDNTGMLSFGSNATKFPEGLKGCVDKISSITGINAIGVWHAFSGYWNGISKNGELAKNHPEWFISSNQGKLLIKPEPLIAEEFFSEWYKILASEGISFVKVDSQSSTRQHYRANAPIGESCSALHLGLDNAVSKHMNGVLINCMGLAMENVLQRPVSGISRNSDDFFPLEEDSFKEHMLQNVYNGLWHNQIYYADWDMFWSSHKYAQKHAVLRALSGGPIYVSDRVGETQKEVLMPLCYEDGTILQADQSALPTSECILKDPDKCGYLKLFNTCKNVHYLAVYSYSESDQDVQMSVKDLGLAESDTSYAIISLVSGQGFVCDSSSIWNLHLSKEEFEMYRIAPIEEGFVAFGLTNKYLSSHAIVSEAKSEDGYEITLRESGTFTFYADFVPEILCREKAVPIANLTNENGQKMQNFYQVDITDNQFYIKTV